jgi:tetratricopeptide (TPR) repeat protein
MRGDKPETAKQVTTESAKETSANKPAPTAETAGTVANNVPRTNQTPTISTNQSETSEIRQAREYVGKENYREAIALYQNYVTSNPNAADAGEINTRIARLKKMVGLLATAKLAMGQRDFEAAARDFEEALQINPDSVAAKAGLALAREAMSRQANRPGALRRQ